MSIESTNIILVHLGAGKHSDQNRQVLKALLALAIRHGDPRKNTDFTCPIGEDMRPFEDSFKALTGISRIVEDSELTNTGFGSSVTRYGDVFCDSSACALDIERGKLYQHALVMNSSRYPIENTIQELSEACSVHRMWSLGITPPLMRVGCVEPDPSLISSRMAQIYSDYKDSLDGESSIGKISHPQGVSDTVGIAVIKPARSIVTATSSGGNLFKEPGRIGCAGVVGSAIYSATSSTDQEITVTVMCSGNGEDIIQMGLAKSVCEHLIGHYREDSSLLACEMVADHVLNISPHFKLRALDDDYKELVYVGLVGYVELNERGKLRKLIFYYHTTQTMVFGYMTSGSQYEYRFSELRKGKREQMGEFLVR
ncbi:DEKNAAC102649 [Brettanomyces naardenensis]|uniref:DEKNAAC102649 n=1 Tax=Brettanomyces naardenensis TaxID=13370 RepID=A0A448YL05_BRENA|nr:DEKNAAC102649 [Brettanomyces naardenensis]